jgi:hypothetical protein
MEILSWSCVPQNKQNKFSLAFGKINKQEKEFLTFLDFA